MTAPRVSDAQLGMLGRVDETGDPFAGADFPTAALQRDLERLIALCLVRQRGNIPGAYWVTPAGKERLPARKGRR